MMTQPLKKESKVISIKAQKPEFSRSLKENPNSMDIMVITTKSEKIVGSTN